ncbi:MAG TPA: type II toxin-antitoxin system VapC family toxin [Streptosporangiaceae bacterium]|nr:type II toxin-antitoxin system VapC family toxin [Streptosporangiaceae bacterium]
MTHLLGTNVISQLRNRAPDPSMLAWYETARPAEILLSVLTIGEIRLGIERLRGKDAAQADRLEQWLHGLRTAYAGHIIGVDTETADEWGRIYVPDPLPIIDGLLPASAKVRGWTLVTRNTSDVASSGVRLLGPFEPPPADSAARG